MWHTEFQTQFDYSFFPALENWKIENWQLGFEELIDFKSIIGPSQTLHVQSSFRRSYDYL